MMMRGEPLLSKLALFAKYVVFPGVMLASIIYAPPDFNKPKKTLDPASQYTVSS